MKNRRVWLYFGIFLSVNIALYAYTLIRKSEIHEPRYGEAFPKRTAYDSMGNEVHWGNGWSLLLYFSDTGDSGS